MKAAVYRGPKKIKAEDVAEPKISGKKVLVNFKAGSICGTDLHFYRGDWKAMKHGRILGHDACGVRADTGIRVAMIPITFCGTCFFCLRGQPGLCSRGMLLGLNRDGFFAEAIALRGRNLVPLPETVTDDEAAIVEPVALAIRTFDMLSPKTNDWVTVIGQGPIGLMMAQIARLKGCKVIAIDKEDYRLTLSRKFGAAHCINPIEEDAVEKVKEITSRGSDIVVEAAGTIEAVEQTPFMVRKAGKVALVGEFEGYMNLASADEATFSTVYLSPVEYPIAVSLIAEKKVDTKGLITHRFKLADFEKAVETANDPSQKPVKVVVTA